MKFYYVSCENDDYHAIIAGNNPEEVREAATDQLGLDVEWEIIPLDELEVDSETPIILTDGW